MSSSAPFASNVVPFPGGLSSRKRTDLCSGAKFDLNGFYAGFNDRWAAYLRWRFVGGPIEVAAHFKISERAAQKWWQGIGGPRGDKLALALITLEGAQDQLLRAA